MQDWEHINRSVPRLVDALPNGPENYATVQVFLAGGVPEVMLHLRRAGLLDVNVTTVAGATLDACLDWWEASERRSVLRKRLVSLDGVSAETSSWIRIARRRAACAPRSVFQSATLRPREQ